MNKIKNLKLYLVFTLLLSNYLTSQDSDIQLKEITVTTKKFIKNRPPMNGNPGFFLEDWEVKKQSQNQVKR